MTESKDLLPCPFCGAPPRELTCPGGTFILCQTCKASSDDSNARAKWNMRTTHPEAQGNKDLGEPDEALTDAATVQALEVL